jgi:membrane fusion protein YbhG
MNTERVCSGFGVRGSAFLFEVRGSRFDVSVRGSRFEVRRSSSSGRGSAFILIAAVLAAACAQKPPADRVRVSGQVEATEVQVAAPVGGRLLELHAVEGEPVKAGDVLARLDTADAQLALARARADRDQADAQYRLLLAGARPEDIRQAEAQRATADADVRAAEADLAGAQADADRFEALLASNSGSRKQRDDAVTRRDVATQRLQAARDRVRAAAEGVARLRAGARREDLDAARARVAAASAQIATIEKAIADATITAPVAGVISEKLVDAGELLQPRAPIAVIADLDHVWANVYVDEPDVPRIHLGQPATVFTDARLNRQGSGGQEGSRSAEAGSGPSSGVPGTVSYVASKAEFTPRNVQTAEDRSKLVYRVKISVDNRAGTLKIGMPVEAEIPFTDARGK